MSGITGIVNPKHRLSKSSLLIEKMTQTLAHRGPDATGIALFPHAHLGHRRLIVKDPAGGSQPLHRSHKTQTYTIVSNATLYNAEEIREKLRLLGFSFQSSSDAEVLLTAYIAWGESCVSEFNGVFAFAIWEEEAGKLFLCRDPLGIKPLYYALREEVLVFGSELKALLAHPFVDPVLDKSGICEILGLGPAHSPHSGVFQDVFQVPPAHFLRYSAHGLNLTEYWKLTSRPHLEDERETQAHVRELLLDAIKRQLVADVPVCTFLSGGLDSSIISVVAAQEFKKQGKPLLTFSLDYQDNDKHRIQSDFVPDSDNAWVDIMVDFLGSDHRKVEFGNRPLLDALYGATRSVDLPGMADIDSSLLLFCREIRKSATVALSGEGADEVFGGYPWYLRPDLAAQNTFPWSDSVQERSALLSPALGPVGLADYVQAQYEQTLQSVPEEEDGSQDPMKKMFFLNIKWFLATLATRKDRMSMANGLETRIPFADRRLVEYAFNIPATYKFYNGREKGMLRKALEGLLPDSVLWRKKSPYPKTFHPQYTALVQKKMRDMLENKNARIKELIDKDVLTALIDSGGTSFGRPWFGQLMTGPQLIAYLIQIEQWMQHYQVRIQV
ncbi:MAG: asparagine synthase (glutamine-hydrolyzing) [Christensenellales bacterium]|jgi:asparagine synthase (glutamine-hydrolysing)